MSRRRSRAARAARSITAELETEHNLKLDGLPDRILTQLDRTGVFDTEDTQPLLPGHGRAWFYRGPWHNRQHQIPLRGDEHPQSYSVPLRTGTAVGFGLTSAAAEHAPEADYGTYTRTRRSGDPRVWYEWRGPHHDHYGDPHQTLQLDHELRHAEPLRRQLRTVLHDLDDLLLEWVLPEDTAPAVTVYDRLRTRHANVDRPLLAVAWAPAPLPSW